MVTIATGSVELVKPEVSALPSVDKAREMLAAARSTGEVKKIRAVAVAVATLERGKEIAIDAGEIILQADARIGELTRDMPLAPAGDARVGRGSPKFPEGTQVAKRDALESEGLSRKQAAECERIAALNDSGDLKRYAAACREAQVMPTTKAAVALAKMDPVDRREAIAAIANPPPPPPRPEWDPEDLLRDIGDRFERWAAEWLKHEQPKGRLLRTIRLHLQLLEKTVGDSK